MKLKEKIDICNELTQLTPKNFPYKVALKLVKLCDEGDVDLKFYNEKNKEILERCAKKNPDGSLLQGETQGQFFLEEDKVDEFYSAIKELEETETEDFVNSIDEDALEPIEISPKSLKILMPIIKQK